MVTAKGATDGVARSGPHVYNKVPNNPLILRLMPCVTFTACEAVVGCPPGMCPLWAVPLSWRGHTNEITHTLQCETCKVSYGRARSPVDLIVDLQRRWNSWGVVVSAESPGQRGCERWLLGWLSGWCCVRTDWVCAHIHKHALIPSHPECTEPVILHIPAPSSCSNGKLKPPENHFKSAGCVISGRRSTQRPSLAPGSSLSPR